MRISMLTTAILATTAQAYDSTRRNRRAHKEVMQRAQDTGSLLRTSADNTLCLGLEDHIAQNNQPVVLQPCDDAKTARWRRQGQALMTGNQYCLDVPDGSNRNGEELQVYSCVPGNSNQAWIQLGEQLQWAKTDKCLDVQDGCFNEDATVQLYQCFDFNSNQAFRLDALAAPITSAAVGYATSCSARSSSTTPPAANAAVITQAPAPSDGATGAGSFSGFSYISFDAFMQLHPVLAPLRQDIIDAAASAQINLPPILLAAQALQESSGNPSVSGGGLGQFSPGTWAQFGQGNINNGRDNLFAMARYLKYLLSSHNNDLSAALNEYSGGLGFYLGDIRRWLSGEYVYGAGT